MGGVATQLHKTGATLLGLYRVRGTGDSVSGYVCTNPSRTATFMFGDLAYVLAPHAWLAMHEHLLNPGNVMAACVIQRAWRRHTGRENPSTPIRRSPRTNSKVLGKADDNTQAAAAKPPRNGVMSHLAKGYALSSRETAAAAAAAAAAPPPSAHHSHDEYPDSSPESSVVSEEGAPIQAPMAKTPFAMRPNLPHAEQPEVPRRPYSRVSDRGSDGGSSFSHRM